jgi:hypothetical protein
MISMSCSASRSSVLVGEVQVEGAVRRFRPADHVVDPHRLEAPLVELGHGSLEQLAHGLPALAAKLAFLGWRTPAVRRPRAAGLAVRAAQDRRLCVH